MKEALPHITSKKWDNAMHWAAQVLVVTVWGSAFLFGLYILAFYFIALLEGNTAQWNEILPGLYDSNTRGATLGIGLHFATGGIILMLGCIQLVERIRIKYPAIHRWLGRLYVISALGAAIGGLVFIFIKGTIGGLIMDIGFAGYGVLMFLAAIATLHYARSGKFELHRAWAIRLFALAIGSWLYRMDYGFWFLFTDGLGHTSNFTGPFDYFMDFFFYLPNLLVAEVFIGRYEFARTKLAKGIATLGLSVATLFLLLATYFFTKKFWGPAILDVLVG
ncbi:MAG: DUF2306 domain-containing protein [Chitinophagales bacterium]|nr:DUF2306 domain-containing protein [Chitinophagales bacterium]